MVNEKDVTVYFCPKCKSVDVRYVFGFGNLFGIVPQMKCSKCGFTSISFPIIVLDKKKLAKKRRTNK
ncbi:MAG: hypothetical protein ABIH79_00430 [archaeon]